MRLNQPVLAVLAVAAVSFATGLEAQTASVTMWHNDLNRTGANPNEFVLNTSNVNTSTFGKLYSLPVDGQIYAQPLYVPSVIIGGVAHNVLYVATMNDSLYAYDADSASPEVLWQVNLGAPVSASDNGIVPSIGILSTPVIDVSLNAIFLVTDTISPSGGGEFSLHSIDIRTGKERVGSPAVISGSVPGTGDGSSNGTLTFDPNQNFQRPALLELNGNIYVCFGSTGDIPPYHGWIFAYNDMTLRRLLVKSMTPNGYGGSIWATGAGPSSDSKGNIYLATANGDFNPAVGDYADTVIKMSAPAGLAMTSTFTPLAQDIFEAQDEDLGTGSVIIMPGPVTLTAPMAVTGSKDGHLYLMNSANLGGYSSTSSDQVVQELEVCGAHFASDVYFNNTLYVWCSAGPLNIFSFNGASFSWPPFTGDYDPYPYFANSPALSVSSNGLTPGTAILWAAHSLNIADGSNQPGMLHAYDAVSGNELWNSGMNTSQNDSPGAWAKFTPPTIANGKVYLATFDSGVAVYGLLPAE